MATLSKVGALLALAWWGACRLPQAVALNNGLALTPPQGWNTW